MIGEALGFPMQRDGWIKTILIGTVLSVLGFLIVPILFVNGYMLRVMAAASRDDPELPAFEEWGALLVDGLKMVGVVIVYVFGVLLTGFVLTTVVGLGVSGLDSGVGLSLGFTLVVQVVLYAAVLYLLPAGLANMAREGSFGAAFDLGALKAAATSGTYLVGVLAAVVVSLVIGLVSSVLALILIGLPLAFYGQIVTYYLLGRAASDPLGPDGSTTAGTGAQLAE